ncbi:hypothetical protein C6P46_005852 [Rhodotorula mucilaginosa]|uniref:Uncharacterized protein n=1 Tax=Rhodotorula mucilaginosa TaxID=5537 RepID=A0A9P6VZJ2_RHOMI|nr:hypothetical protein C6P46_005852 [Rhodotorula mucilaginosa]
MVVNALTVRPQSLLPFHLGLHRYHPVATRCLPGPCPLPNDGSADGHASDLLRKWEEGKLCSSGTPYSLDSLEFPAFQSQLFGYGSVSFTFFGQRYDHAGWPVATHYVLHARSSRLGMSNMAYVTFILPPPPSVSSPYNPLPHSVRIAARKVTGYYPLGLRKKDGPRRSEDENAHVRSTSLTVSPPRRVVARQAPATCSHPVKQSMPVALARYLEPYNAYLRPLGYYATWTFYFLSFAVSPGLVTLLQALCLVLTWILPSVELNVERGRRRILASRWIQPEWAWPDAVPFHRREWPQWARNAASYFDVRPTLAVAWNACAARLRALSRRMGWDVEAPHAAGARRGEPFQLRLRTEIRDSSSSRRNAAVASNVATSPRAHSVADRPASLAPSARSNPFASRMPPRSASLGAIPSREAMSAHASGVQLEHGSIAGSLRSRASNPFSVDGHSARSIPTRAPRAPSASLRSGVAGPAWSVASAHEAAVMRDGDGSFWGDGGSWDGA